ncbi:MAG: gamma-glutamyl-gamma-aminobutyrate hydrolase family protein, partial [Oscillospiraceae bacterium]|nr:gamma-glutamyl-gamma-aminobutyrate hydrolase family protein [Oscillospiraceae bacterium]
QGTGHFVASKKYARALRGRGLTALTPLDASLGAEYAARAGGLVIADGPPIHKGRYGGIYETFEQMSALQLTRDELEFALLDAFLAIGKPVLGIGRGAALINAALGGEPERLADGLRVTERLPDGGSASFRHAGLPLFGIPAPLDSVCAGRGLDGFADAVTGRAAAQPLPSALRPAVLLAGAPAYDRLYREPAVLLNKTYSRAVSAAGGAPVLALGDAALAGVYGMAADALILTGTSSFVPETQLLPKLMAEERPARGAFDGAVYRAFKAARKPILGICLGHQMINVWEGGTIVHNFKLTDGVEHMMLPHAVETKRGGVLRELFGGTFIVNSRHNDKIGELAAVRRATASSPDGVIEAAEHREMPIYTVQWHPERMRGDFPEPYDGADMGSLFEWFVREVSRSR